MLAHDGGFLSQNGKDRITPVILQIACFFAWCLFDFQSGLSIDIGAQSWFDS